MKTLNIRADRHHYGLSDLWSVPVYLNRTDYEKRTGAICPPYNPNHPPKYWADPEARSKAVNGLNNYRVVAGNQAGYVEVDDWDKVVWGETNLMTQHAETVNIPAMEATGDVTKIPMRELDAQLAEYVDYSGGELVLRRVVKVDPPHDQVMRAFAQLRSDATSDTQNILANIFDLKAGLETMKTKLDAVLIAIGKSKAEEPGTLHLTLPPGDGEIKEVEIVPEPVKKKK